MSLLCNACERPLKPHCTEPTERGQSRCDWWKCTNDECDHQVYDVARELLLWRDRHVERLGL